MLIKIFYRSIVLNEGVSVNVYTPLYKFVKEKVILEKIKFN